MIISYHARELDIRFSAEVVGGLYAWLWRVLQPVADTDISGKRGICTADCNVT